MWGKVDAVQHFQAASTFVLVSQTSQPSVPQTSTAQGPGAEVTIVGGPNVTVAIPGPQSDAIDLFGIIPVLLAIGAAIAGARWLFGRSKGMPVAPPARASGSDPTPTQPGEPR